MLIVISKLFVNFILSAPTIFLQIPILINMVVHIAMSIVIFVFSAVLFGDGWPDSNFCLRFGTPSEGDWGGPLLPETRECAQARDVIRITLGISAGFSIIIG